MVHGHSLLLLGGLCRPSLYDPCQNRLHAECRGVLWGFIARSARAWPRPSLLPPQSASHLVARGADGGETRISSSARSPSSALSLGSGHRASSPHVDLDRSTGGRWRRRRPLVMATPLLQEKIATTLCISRESSSGVGSGVDDVVCHSQ